MNSAHPVSLRFPSLASFSNYVIRQLERCTPDITPLDETNVEKYICAALARMMPILSAVRAFEAGKFDHLNSMQYSSFLFLLSNEIWLNEGTNDTSDKLFLLNRSLNSIDLYYKIRMPQVFVIAHGLGSVLVNTTYGENFVFFQNVTVGRLGDDVPTIGDNVVLFPNSMVLGNSIIGSNSVVSAGTVISNTHVPENSIVFANGRELVIAESKKNYTGIFIRQERCNDD